MKISVFGLGYVGCVSAACLASRGNTVVGVDVNPTKIDLIMGGHAPVVEERIGELTAAVVADGSLTATTDVAAAIRDTDVSLVCVGTPILEKASGKTAGVGFGVAVNPEFLREGSSVRDFFDPPKTVIGEFDPASGDAVAALYDGLPGEVFRVPIPVAEITKYADNSFHALKIGFANELGSICAALGLDSHQVMDVFVADRKLNISPAYLRPGFAFGGSCLPKDVRGLVHAAHRADVSVPILAHVLPSNEAHLKRAFDLVTRTGKRKVGLFGLSFKPGTDDLRESPMVELAERLLGKGYELKIYDANVTLSRLLGANREYIEQRLPHLGQLLAGSVGEVLDHAEVCLVASTDPDVLAALPPDSGRTLIDLVRLPDADVRRTEPGYVGLAW
jgi:GDP-mannose 6-dehydrogenase